MNICDTGSLIRAIPIIVILLAATLVAEGGQAFLDGREAVAEADYPRAIELLNTATTEDGVNPEAWRLLGFSYRMSDSLLLAVRAYERVIELQQDDYDALLSLGVLYAYTGDMTASSSIYTEILAGDSTDVEAWLGLARNLSWEDDLVKSEWAYRNALFHVPDYARSLLGLAEVLAWQDKSSEARKVYNQLLAVDSTYAEAWTGLSKTWHWSDRPYKALRCLNKARHLDSGNSDIDELISRIHQETAWRHNPAYSYWAEDDAGLISENESIGFSTHKRISDTFTLGGKLTAFSAFRDNIWKYRRQVGVDGVIHAFPGTRFMLETQVDVLSGDLDVLQLQGSYRGRGKWDFFKARLSYENVLYELWSETRADGVFGEIGVTLPAQLNLTAGGGRWGLSDDNEKMQATANLQIDVLKKIGLSFRLFSKYLDFKETVIGYWTPQKLRYDGAGLRFERRICRFVQVAGYGEYAVNTDMNRFISLDGSLSFNLPNDYQISTGVTWFETDTSYRMVRWNVSLVAGGLF